MPAMKNDAVIVAAEVLTSLGNLDQTWESLISGQSGLSPFQIDGLAPDLYFGKAQDDSLALGSHDRLTTLIGSLLPDLTQIRPYLKKSELVVTTTKGTVDELLDRHKGPWHGQVWQVGEILQDLLGIGGGATLVSGACASGTLGVIEAASKIWSGQADSVAVVGVDILSRFVTAGFLSLYALSPFPCRPFDRDRQGLSLGEGIGFVLLSSRKSAKKTGLPIHAIVHSCGAACDAEHLTAPDRAGRGLIQVLSQCTDEGRLLPGGINAHGTGTKYNDAMEMTAFKAVFGAGKVPVHSIKGATGHTLGAAGVIETAIAVKSLGQGVLPPTIGLQQPEEKKIPVSGHEPLELRSPSVLSCNSGFGGINAGILLTGG